MSREAFKALVHKTLQVKQALIPFTDISTINSTQTEDLKTLLEPIANAARDFERERKQATKSSKTPAMNKKIQEMEFRIDSEGVFIYNKVGELSASRAQIVDPGQIDIILAQARLAASKIVRSANDVQNDEQSATRLLDMFSETFVHLSLTGQQDAADAAMDQAAALEDVLLPSDEEEQDVSESAVLSLIAYYMGRVEIAVRQQMAEVGRLFMDKALALALNHSVPIHKYRDIATKCWEAGEEIRVHDKGDTDSCLEAVEWLQRGLELIQYLQKRIKPVMWLKDLNVAVHRSLVRCHLTIGVSCRESLEKAKAVFFDLAKLVDLSDPSISCESAIFNLRILRMSDAPLAEIKTCIETLLSELVWSHDVVDELLGAFAFRDQEDELSGEALRCILEAAEASEEGRKFSGDILLSVFVFLRQYAKKKPAKGIRLARPILDLISRGDDATHTNEADLAACETIIWGLGDHFGTEGHDEIAVLWYELALHAVFQKAGLPANQHIIRRKAAMCYIQSQHFAKAQEVLRPCPQDQAATQYLNFLAALSQGKDDAAMQAIDNIRRCPDLEPSQLQLIVSMADEMQSRSVLIKALSALLDAMKDPETAKILGIGSFTIIRALVRLILSQLSEDSDTSEEQPQVESLIRHLGTAHEVFDQVPELGVKAQDIVWLYKSAFNIAVQGVSKWSADLVARVFDCAVVLMSDYETLDQAQGDPELPAQLASAHFAVLSGKVLVYREMEQGDDKALLLDYLQGYLPDCRTSIEKAIDLDPKSTALLQMEKTVDVFHVELCCEDQDWEELGLFTQKVIGWEHTPDRTETLEIIIDIASRYTQCPADLIWQINEHIHKSITMNSPQEVSKFARSTRALLTVQAREKGSEAEQKMIDMIEHVISVLRGHVGQQAWYPDDEGTWLLATTFNRGLDCFDEEDYEGAGLWNGIAMDLCPLVKSDAAFDKRIHEQDQNLRA